MGKHNDYTQVLILLLIMAAGIIAWMIWSAKREISDAQAMFWASVSEPLFFISRHAFDFEVVAMADEARAKLAEHGNKWLDPEKDVRCWVYGSDISNPSRDFSTFHELALKRALIEMEAYRVQKTAYSQTAAHAQFSQQRASQN
jgi:hypothetical protein